ncbi:hypothetical protein FGO68_gene3417 [Halteria grandinella]|uniref:C2 domain-containing protein n=1 Tax=Halteria grandinella TaxID=5974 RepID=A0A8J8NDH1_HALGN|nr:hypothetical protein FGO68_gene3417 [Halteria grandinella]
MASCKCIVRVYIIDAFNLSSRDNGSDSDPYLVVSMGNKVYNERDRYQSDEPNPKFYRSFDFEGIFPGCAPLVINVMDYDEIFGDDSIGTTSVDLEDRFFSPEWQSVKNKPIELRQLSHPSSAISQGTVRMWVEIHPTSIPMSEIPIWNITPKPPDYFEVRLVIYDTEDVVANDAEGCSDVYCRAFFDSKEDAKETDTHYRCSNGKASFNYRLLYTIAHPRKDYTLSVQLFDRDLIGSNDIIGEAQLNIKDALTDAALTKKPVAFSKKYYNSYLKNCKTLKNTKVTFKDENSFFLSCKGGKPDKTGKLTEQGKVRIQIDILPKDYADKNKVGEARQEPNHSPTLKEPEGRLSLDMNPLKLALAMIGPDLKRKIIMTLLCGVCLFLCVMLIPLVAGNIMSDLIMKLIGLG